MLNRSLMDGIGESVLRASSELRVLFRSWVVFCITNAALFLFGLTQIRCTRKCIIEHLNLLFL